VYIYCTSLMIYRRPLLPLGIVRKKWCIGKAFAFVNEICTLHAHSTFLFFVYKLRYISCNVFKSFVESKSLINFIVKQYPLVPWHMKRVRKVVLAKICTNLCHELTAELLEIFLTTTPRYANDALLWNWSLSTLGRWGIVRWKKRRVENLAWVFL
jgi:hypothetical protein